MENSQVNFSIGMSHDKAVKSQNWFVKLLFVLKVAVKPFLRRETTRQSAAEGDWQKYSQDSEAFVWRKF